MRTARLGLAMLLALGCGGGGAADAGRDARLSLDCTSYCSGIAAACTGDFAQYASPASCMGACAAIAPGQESDTGGNTLGCRLYHVVEVGELHDQTHCDHAGPAGEDECGTNCEGFCTIALHTCASAYADMNACMTECAMFPDTAELNITVTSGNSLSCRLQHLTLAAASTAAATTECPNIRLDSPTCMAP